SYGWQVLEVDWTRTGEYSEDAQELFDAIEEAKAETDKPTLIVLKTIIGYPAPNKGGSESVHANALGADDAAAAQEERGSDPNEHFVVEDDVIAHPRSLATRSAEARAAWQADFDAWAAANPEKKALYDRLEAHALPEGIESSLPVFEGGTELSTRAASGKVI